MPLCLPMVGLKVGPQGRAQHWMLTGIGWRRPRLLVRCNARRWIGCSAAGRWIILPSSSRLICFRACSRPTISTRTASIRSRAFCGKASPSNGWGAHRSSCSSPQPTFAPAAAASFEMPNSRQMSCWPRPACQPCSRPLKLMVNHTGTAVLQGTRRLLPLFARVTRKTRSLYRSIRASGPAHRGRLPKSSIG